MSVAKTQYVAGYPAVYALIFSRMTQVARACGYALGLHGSLGRDLDVIAVPWETEAVSADELVTRIREDLKGFVTQDVAKPLERPHGRLSYVIYLGGGAYVDLSVMPRELRR